MKYRVEYLPQVVKTLEKMDKYTKRIILEWIEKNLVGCENPRIHGKPLTANRVGQWRYRIGDYRVIVQIEDGRLVILVIAIGHRREIYN
ncbi:MAG: type II toxin-antitoxin system RelE/ParE family toxin [Bacilli bacterium]|nr:type II toxin-antitoxin system RelE/ParE family toxin [Bacilli bacterium]